MPQTWKDIWHLLDRPSQLQYLKLVLLSCVSSVVQAMGVSAIPLFFTVLIEGHSPSFVPNLIKGWSITQLGIVVFILLVSGSLLSAWATYFGIKIAWNQYPRLASRVLRQFLNNKYEWHLEKNSNELGKVVLSETNNVVLFVLQQVVMLIVKGSEVLLIAICLFAVKPLVALAAAGSFFSIYFLLYSLNRKFIARQGEILVNANTERYQTTNECLSGVKTVKAYECEDYFVNLFNRSAGSYSQASANIQYFSLLPKYFIEIIIFGGLVGFVVISELRTWRLYESIPLITMYGAAALRMLPGIQQCYFSASAINSTIPALRALTEGLKDLSSQRDRPFTESHSEEVLRLDDVSYTYPGTDRPSLHNISFSVRQGEKVGVVGVTGAGKTTLIDILLGLLEPSQGQILIRDTHAGSRAEYVGYVPQTISFVDGTVAENIAIGQPAQKRSLERLKAAAQAARIAEHIESLPLGYDSPLGEQAVRFSGGQRQRIGIARALYRQPEILVLDEASSALDAKTEQEVFTSLLRDDLTLIVIAHRLSVLKSCTNILLLNGGRVVAQGTYDDLIDKEPLFAALAASQSDWAETAAPPTPEVPV